MLYLTNLEAATMEKLNKFWIGFIGGLIIPIVFVYAFIGTQYTGQLSFWELLQKLYQLRGLTALMAVAVLPNLILFYFYLHKEYWAGGKGVILAVLLYAFLVVLFYFLNQ